MKDLEHLLPVPGKLYGDVLMIIFVLGLTKRDNGWKVLAMRHFCDEDMSDVKIVRYSIDASTLSRRWWVECHQI